VEGRKKTARGFQTGVEGRKKTARGFQTGVEGRLTKGVAVCFLPICRGGTGQLLGRRGVWLGGFGFAGGEAGAEKLCGTGFVLLGDSGDGEGTLGHVVGHGGACGDDGVLADTDRGDKLGV